ncbi:MAG: type I-E CRISPR-associated protein Cas6/Cse3/CasE [Syntrophales bacterium]
MFLSRIHLDPRCREARRDLANPYELHSTLCRAFTESDRKCPEGEFLWRLEPETDLRECPRPRILVQSRSLPVWPRIGVKGWLADDPDPGIDLNNRLKLDALKIGQRFRLRLRANPCVTRDGKRQGLLKTTDQESWLARKGQLHGFSLPQLASFDLSESSDKRLDIMISQEQMLRSKRRDGIEIKLYSVLYDGILTVSDPDSFRAALQTGVGHGKAMGLGLLSVVPVS